MRGICNKGQSVLFIPKMNLLNQNFLGFKQEVSVKSTYDVVVVDHFLHLCVGVELVHQLEIQ